MPSGFRQILVVHCKVGCDQERWDDRSSIACPLLGIGAGSGDLLFADTTDVAGTSATLVLVKRLKHQEVVVQSLDSFPTAYGQYRWTRRTSSRSTRRNGSLDGSIAEAACCSRAVLELCFAQCSLRLSFTGPRCRTVKLLCSTSLKTRWRTSVSLFT